MSFTQTFVATFALTVLMQLQAGDIVLTTSALVAVSTAAFRSALKAAINAVLFNK